MIEDLLTVMWKESKGLMRVRGSRTRAILTALVPVASIAILMPIQIGTDWFSTAFSLFGAVIMPLLLIGMTVPESFAGERERHTLDTLLASRLPDRAILFGKVGLAVLYGWAMSLIVVLVALIPVNVLHWSGRITLYRPVIFVGNVLISLLISGAMASLGVLISLRASTAQGAQQTLMSVVLLPLLAVQVVPALLLSVIPDGRAILSRLLSVDLTTVVTVVVAVLAAANVALLLAAMARFQRSRLMLS
jgi:ABC-2 type transport system permease protein